MELTLNVLVVENGVVVDAIVVESLDYNAGEGRSLITAETGGIGWIFDGVQLVPPDTQEAIDR